MDAMILAAGYGSRLESLSPSKPLTTVGGVSLLEIAARQLAASGVSRIVVVTGHKADDVEAVLPAIEQRVGVEMIGRRVDDCSKPNGFSVMAGAEALPSDYLLVMCDHILSTPILHGLAATSRDDRDVTLAIDRRTDHPLIDPDDATWVKMAENGFIRAIGKSLSDFDAVDCGAFLATPRLADAIAQAVSQGRAGSLSDGMQVLADTGRAATMDIGNAWWIDVDDPRAHGLAEAQAGAFIELPAGQAADQGRAA